MTCLNCGKELEAKTKRARFCPGGACKMAYHRRSVTKGVTQRTVTAQEPVTVTSDVGTLQEPARTLERRHAIGCPCWSCKGVPAKKEKK